MIRTNTAAHYIGSMVDHHGLAYVASTYNGRYRLIRPQHRCLAGVRAASVTPHTGTNCLECAALEPREIAEYLNDRIRRAVVEDSMLTVQEKAYLIATVPHEPVPGSRYAPA